MFISYKRKLPPNYYQNNSIFWYGLLHFFYRQFLKVYGVNKLQYCVYILNSSKKVYYAEKFMQEFGKSYCYRREELNFYFQCKAAFLQFKPAITRDIEFQ